MYSFIPLRQVSLLKNLKLCFQTAQQLDDIFISNPHVSRANHNKSLSKSEFEQAVSVQYEAMEAHLKAAVSWPYYLEQAMRNKAEIEQQLIAVQLSQAKPLPKLSDYNGLCCLRLFSNITDQIIWQQYGQGHQGVVVQWDVLHPYFQSPKHQELPQTFAPVCYDDLRPDTSKQSPLTGLLQRAEVFAHEQEWRLIRPIKSALKQHEFGPVYPINHLAIKGVYAGVSCSPVTLDVLKVLSEQDRMFKHVGFFQMAVSETHLRIAPVKF